MQVGGVRERCAGTGYGGLRWEEQRNLWEEQRSGVGV